MSRGRCTLFPTFTLIQCLGSGKGTPYSPLTWFFLSSSSFQHDRDPYTRWFSDAAVWTGDSQVCVRCPNPHEGVALQVAPHMPGWPLHLNLRCNSIDLMISASAACSALFYCMYQSDFQSPFLFTGASGLYLYLMYSDIIVQVLAVIPSIICMWDSLSCCLYSSFLCHHVLYCSIPCLLDALFFVLCLGEHRYASLAAYSTSTH